MILNGWKEIANHLGRGVRTVQRWEELGLPVRRPKGTDRSAVLALSEELDAWVKRCATHVNGAPDVHEGMARLMFKVQRIQELMQQVRAERQELSERTRQLRSGMQELRQRFGHSAQRVHVMAAAAAQAEAQNPPPPALPIPKSNALTEVDVNAGVRSCAKVNPWGKRCSSAA